MATKKPAAARALPPLPLGEGGGEGLQLVTRYLVGTSPILQDGCRYESGTTLTCTAAQAARLGLKPAPLNLPNLEGLDK